MSELYNKVFTYKQKGINENEYCNLIHSSFLQPSALGYDRWGIFKYPWRSLAIDSMPNVIDFPERLENEENVGLILELRACDMSCCGGILVQDRFSVKERDR